MRYLVCTFGVAFLVISTAATSAQTPKDCAAETGAHARTQCEIQMGLKKPSTPRVAGYGSSTDGAKTPSKRSNHSRKNK